MMMTRQKDIRMIKSLLELMGDALIVALGILLIFIFTSIEILGYYGVEQNRIIRSVELYAGIPIMLFGLYHFFSDLNKL